MPDQKPTDQNLAELTAGIVSAYVAHNALSSSDLPKFIADVYRALQGLEAPHLEPEVADEMKPAVSVRKSITPDFLICLDDGKKFKSLRRHLAILGMTPAQYREKWHLPGDYPMVAPSYSAARSNMAKSFGLGRKPVEPPAPPQPAPALSPVRRGRRKASVGAAAA